MSDRFELTRRKALLGIGTLAAGAAGSQAVGVDVDGARSLLDAGGTTGWHTAKTDTSRTLTDVADTLLSPYAVGHGGVVLKRTTDGVWQTEIEDGPSGNGKDLFAADVTDNGRRLWFAGASGALGEYDVKTGTLVAHDPLGADGTDDYSAPLDQTGNFDGLAVTGTADEAHVYVTDQSGHVFASHDNGETWSDTTPGSGSTIPAIDFRDEKKGHLCDTNGSVFATEDGESWEKVGIPNADVNYYGIESDGDGDSTVVGGNGVIREQNGDSWGESDVGDVTLNGVYTTSMAGEVAGAAVGDRGAVFENPGEWTEAETPTDEELNGVTYGDVTAAVGANGTVIEK